MLFASVIPLQLASIEGFLFFLIIVGLSALSNWLQKRQQAAQQAKEEEEGSGPGEGRVPDWEAELRRLLGQEEVGRPAPKPPPRLREERPPQPIVMEVPSYRETRPPVVSEAAEAEARKLARQVEQADEEVRRRQALIRQRVEQVRQSATRQVQRLDAEVAQRATRFLKEGWRGPAFPTTAERRSQRRPVPPSVRRLFEALRNPDAAREAVIAYEVLGPPKALGSRPAAAWEYHLPPAEQA
ncbi:MAG: hypothetical protein D6766_08840 [Verrucomicrobia bacterium]|nr:MAG: hypothetical protein D6766_08840 [Verrucomicrobiota bacterium]